MASEHSHRFAALDGAEFMVLTTYRKDGRPVPTTVWFAEQDSRLYVTTGIATGKAKRIRNNERVALAPSDRVGSMSGPTVEGRARILGPDEAPLADAALNRKYGEQRARITAGMGRDPATTIYLEIVPTE